MSPPPDRTQNFARVRRVLWGVLFANLAVTAVKLTLGFLTGALAVVADGFHSLVDTSSNLIALGAIRMAERPPDEHHPYGYSRYETIGTFAIGGMLLVAAFEVSREIVRRIAAGEVPELSPLTFWLVVATFPVNVAIYRFERRAGRTLDSQVLLADASHTGTDLYVTAAVIVSLVAVRLGLPILDRLVAAFVVVLILRAAFRILRTAAFTLTDRIVADPDEVERIARAVPGVVLVHRVRSRGASGSGFVDLHVKVHSEMTTEQAHAIATEVERRLRADLPEITDALVHIEPAAEQPGLLARIRYDLRQIADGMGLAFHDLHVNAEEDGSFSVELHLEMPAGISLQDAHAQADEFERRVAEGASRPFRLIAHLEPVPDDVLHTDPDIPEALRDRIRDLIVRRTGERRLRDLQTYRFGLRIGVTAAVTIRSDASLSEAHALSENLERELLNTFPQIHRVTVHIEPEDK
ncbi:MAG TPA: cation diffusion facilitator family transporter [Anaerolineales bacterium]|nr:cation diffusion facilitator family transporter [Anaerolineales bacterium]